MEEVKLIKKTRDIIIELLEKKADLRDCDGKLIANIWYKELGGRVKVKSMTAMEVLKEIATGNITSSESIRRTRCKIQEEVPHLRGKLYQERQNKASSIKESIVKKQAWTGFIAA